MSPITHFLIGWTVANAADLNRRERALVAVAGVIPDIDALGLAAEVLTRHSSHPLLWWSEYHHVIGHNLGFGLLMTGIAFVLARRRWQTAALVSVSFHLHLLGDLVGARGPEGEQWPIPYLLPFSSAWPWTWHGQWALNAWPNFVVTAALLALMVVLACRRGYSPLEMISARADRAFVETVRRRCSRRPSEKPLHCSQTKHRT